MLIFSSAVASLEYGGKLLGYKGIISQMRPRRYHTVPRESVESIFEEIHDFLNFVVVEFQRIVFVENIVTTFAVSFHNTTVFSTGTDDPQGLSYIILWVFLDQVPPILELGLPW